MQWPYRKIVGGKYIKMYIEDYCGRVGALLDLEKDFGRESVNLCSQSTGRVLNHMLSILIRVLNKIFRERN